MKNIYEVQASNKRKSAIIIALFTVFIFISLWFILQAMSIYMGYRPGGLGIFGIAMIVSGLTSFGSYYYSDKIVLGISSARPADREEFFDFYTATENLALAAGLPKPRLYVINDTAPNAFATGRNPENAVVCATTGLLQKLDRTELEGVIAHELTHIKNYDVRLMSVVSVMVGVIALLGDWFARMTWFGSSRDSDNRKGAGIIIFIGIVFAILAPFVGKLIQLAISRRREFMADAGAVSLTRQPSGLISALKKISEDSEPLEVANKATAHMYIENPFKDRRRDGLGQFASLFNTHPPVSQRIAELEAMS